MKFTYDNSERSESMYSISRQRNKTISSIILLTVCILLTPTANAKDDPVFQGWVFPNSKLKEQSLTPVKVTSADKKTVQTVNSGSGQYETEKPFHEVVEFYVNKSGLTPSNWSILGREFPGTKTYIPAHFSRKNFYREEPSVTILHNIREDIATLHLLVTDHPQLGFVSVTVSRGRNAQETVIQLIHHSADKIKRGKP